MFNSVSLTGYFLNISKINSLNYIYQKIINILTEENSFYF